MCVRQMDSKNRIENQTSIHFSPLLFNQSPERIILPSLKPDLGAVSHLWLTRFLNGPCLGPLTSNNLRYAWFSPTDVSVRNLGPVPEHVVCLMLYIKFRALHLPGHLSADPRPVIQTLIQPKFNPTTSLHACRSRSFGLLVFWQ